MKHIIKSVCILSIIVLIAACEKDEGKLPDISFKEGTGYLSENASLPIGSTVVMGINASKSEDKDVLKTFNISRSTNGAAASTVFTKSLDGSEEDTFDYDYTTVLDTLVGQIDTYTFTVTNRDGLVNQVALTITLTN